MVPVRPRMSIDALGLIGVLLGFLAGCGTPWIGGIHARMAYSESGGLRVVEVPEGPARVAGLAVDDRITAIEGEHVDGLPERDVVERLRGPVGSRVTLTVLRDGHERQITLERAPYQRRDAQ